MTLSLCMIVKDEAEHIDECLRSVEKYVDEIVIVDTGSSDDTKARCLAHGAKVFEFTAETHPDNFFRDESTGTWCLDNFGEARNFSFAKATSDFIMWLDADDIVDGAERLPTLASSMAKNGQPVALMAYDYAKDQNGNVICRLWRERIIKRGLPNAKWVNNVHEVIINLDFSNAARPGDVKIVHRRDVVASKRKNAVVNRNYKILKRLVEKTKDNIDPRTLFYLGNEARYVDVQEAIEAYDQYVQKSGWTEERAVAQVSLGELYEAIGDLHKAKKEFSVAVAETPNMPDGWFALARISYLKAMKSNYRPDWDACIEQSERGFSLGNPESILAMNPMDRLCRPHVYYNVALNAVGRIEDALASCNEGLKYNPGETHLLYNKGLYEKALDERRRAQEQEGSQRPMEIAISKDERLDAPPRDLPMEILSIWALQIWKHLRKKADYERAKAFLEALPEGIRDDSVVRQALAKTEQVLSVPMEKRPKAGLDIIVWTGPAVEWWNPNSPNVGGIGGSETACIEMCRNLVERGHSVRVYSDCPHHDGNYDGVEYYHFGKLSSAECDVFISSRQPDAIKKDVRAKAYFLWVHDIHVGAPGPAMHEMLLSYDRILALSNWHKSFLHHTYPWLPDEQVLVTRNGINPARFLGDLPKKKNHLIYPSSADRGVDILLEVLPEIRRRVPDTELHIYYGFDSWKRAAQLRGATNELLQIDNYQKAFLSTPGVVYHGRVGQQNLARAMLEAKVWAYPTWFTESSCISAMENQAAGCVPVTTRLAALAETVKHGILLDPPNTSEEYKKRFVDEVCSLLTDEERRRQYADAGRSWAMNNLSWAALAEDWETMFYEVIERMSQYRVPRYMKPKFVEVNP
jgi:glycosyltransferase involved in cell wall biosynthesis